MSSCEGVDGAIFSGQRAETDPDLYHAPMNWIPASLLRPMWPWPMRDAAAWTPAVRDPKDGGMSPAGGPDAIG